MLECTCGLMNPATAGTNNGLETVYCETAARNVSYREHHSKNCNMTSLVAPWLNKSISIVSRKRAVANLSFVTCSIVAGLQHVDEVSLDLRLVISLSAFGMNAVTYPPRSKT